LTSKSISAMIQTCNYSAQFKPLSAPRWGAGCPGFSSSRMIAQPATSARGLQMPKRLADWNGTEEQRFWRRIELDEITYCWNWTGAKSHGYGTFRLRAVRKMGRVHVWAYKKYIGPIPEGLELDHLCRNPGCANPWHTEPVTSRINVLRGQGTSAINARKTHCNRGHPLSGENLIVARSGKRRCRTCHLAWRRAHGV
jgi:hypothetical protein